MANRSIFYIYPLSLASKLCVGFWAQLHIDIATQQATALNTVTKNWSPMSVSVEAPVTFSYPHNHS